MGQLMIKSGGRAGGNSYADVDDAGTRTLPPVPAEQYVAALAGVLKDEINALRALPLVGLAAYTDQDIIDKMRAKL